jgi:hypothetical protein
MPSPVSLRSRLSCLFAAGILTGCTTLATTFNRIHAEMTKEEMPEESRYYGAFFLGSLSSYSELPRQWSGANFRQYDRASTNGPERDHADPDLIGRVRENTTDLRNAQSTGQFQESDKNRVAGHQQPKHKKRNPPQTQTADPEDP